MNMGSLALIKSWSLPATVFYKGPLLLQKKKKKTYREQSFNPPRVINTPHFHDGGEHSIEPALSSR